MLRINYTGEDIYKILAGWSGSYLYGASWKLNSGVTKVEQDGDYFLFHGHSGSVYRCHKACYGFSGYTAGIYQTFVDDYKDTEGLELEPLDGDVDFMSIKYDNSQD